MPVICVDELTYRRILSYADRIGASAELLVCQSINEWLDLMGDAHLQRFRKKVYAVSLGKESEVLVTVDEPKLQTLPSPDRVTCIDAPRSRTEKLVRKSRSHDGKSIPTF